MNDPFATIIILGPNNSIIGRRTSGVSPTERKEVLEWIQNTFTLYPHWMTVLIQKGTVLDPSPMKDEKVLFFNPNRGE